MEALIWKTNYVIGDQIRVIFDIWKFLVSRVLSVPSKFWFVFGAAYQVCGPYLQQVVDSSDIYQISWNLKLFIIGNWFVLSYDLRCLIRSLHWYSFGIMTYLKLIIWATRHFISRFFRLICFTSCYVKTSLKLFQYKSGKRYRCDKIMSPLSSL